jgi:hypothetical protein
MGNLLISGGKPKKPSPEKQQQQLEQQYGVLLPPIFTVSQDDGYVATTTYDSMPISTQAQRSAYASPNLVDNIWRLTAGYNLLTEYMSPGIYFAGTYVKQRFNS